VTLTVAKLVKLASPPSSAWRSAARATAGCGICWVRSKSSSRPGLQGLQAGVRRLTRIAPVRRAVAEVWICLAVLPRVGSAITEPAAMTLAALMLAGRVFTPAMPEQLKHGALGVLFVNVSVGGTLTSFAAPPVLVVAARWNWDSAFMASHSGWKARIAVLLNATVMTVLLRRHLTPRRRKPTARRCRSQSR
jgi:hypothetical protein